MTNGLYLVEFCCIMFQCIFLMMSEIDENIQKVESVGSVLLND